MISAKPFNIFSKVESNKYRVVVRINAIIIRHDIEMQHHIIFFLFQIQTFKTVIGKNLRGSDGAPFLFMPVKDVVN